MHDSFLNGLYASVILSTCISDLSLSFRNAWENVNCVDVIAVIKQK